METPAFVVLPRLQKGLPDLHMGRAVVSSERLSNLAKVTQPAGKRVQVRTQDCLTPSTRNAFSTTPQLLHGIVDLSVRCLPPAPPPPHPRPRQLNNK